MKVIKLQFENEHGKYRLYTKEEDILELLKINFLSSQIIDAKSGEVLVHREKIIESLKIEPHKE